MDVDPIALIYSYYEFYARQKEQERKADNVEEGSTTSPHDVDKQEQESSKENEAAASSLLWTTDTWTAADQAAAAAEIQQFLDRCQVSDALRRRLPTDTRAWDAFYQQHQTNFFKDRHYLATAFPNEFQKQRQEGYDDKKNNNNTADDDRVNNQNESSRRRTLVEIGCGVGNTMLPLLEPNNYKPEWNVYGIDLSAVAIDLLQRDERFLLHSQNNTSDRRAWAGVADLVQDGLPAPCRGVADVATLLFCLSAIGPEHQATAAANAVQALKPGAVLVLRDYGRYDQAQLQLARQRGKRLQEHFYVKQDQTKCYYFSTDELRTLFVEQNDLEELENRYIQRQYQNRGDKTTRRRVWVQARFRRRTT